MPFGTIACCFKNPQLQPTQNIQTYQKIEVKGVICCQELLDLKLSYLSGYQTINTLCMPLGIHDFFQVY